MCITSQINCLMSSEFLDEHTYSVINRYLAIFDTHRHLIYCVRYFKTHKWVED